jgi:hypothetical protein
MGLETPKPVIYPPLPPPAVKDPWAWYCNIDEDDDDDGIEEESKCRPFLLLFLVFDAKGGRRSIYLAIFIFLGL